MSNIPNSQDETGRTTGEVPVVFPGPQSQKKNSSLKWIGLLVIIFAFVVTAGLLLVVLMPDDSDDPAPEQQESVLNAQVTATATIPPATPVPTVTSVADGTSGDDSASEEATPVEAVTAEVEPTQVVIEPATDAGDAPATAAPDQIESLLQAPLVDEREDNAVQIERTVLDPFTIIPERPRTEFITYDVQEGDTIESIADRFSLAPESIAWTNDTDIVQRWLQPGDVLDIPPTDGVMVKTVGTTRTIAYYAEEYEVADPYVIIDSPLNPELRTATPDTVPPDATDIFIPGGQAENIVWVAAIEVTEGSTSSSTSSGNNGGSSGTVPSVAQVRFQAGQPGDCGLQDAVGGTAWVNPLDGGYRITRGFSSYHSGIDLAASPGTPVKAANGGRVIFSGWNGFGYGYMIAVVHGATMTVYGHLSAYYTSCGQDVYAGQVIGEVGSTGNSSGPHLHFEIRSRQGSSYVPMNPAFTIGF